MPVADKLIQVAETYGFDGWFINQETEGAEERTLTRDDTVKMQEFIKYFKKQAPEMRLVYYDSMTSEGKMDWQNALTDKNTMFMTDEEGNAVADEMFLNFCPPEIQKHLPGTVLPQLGLLLGGDTG